MQLTEDLQNEMLMDVPRPLSVLSSSYKHVVSHLAVCFSRFQGFPHTIATFLLNDIRYLEALAL